MKINVLLFDLFETLDAFGPVEILGRLDGANLCFYSVDGGLVKSAQSVLTQTLPIANAQNCDVLLVPGGMGTRTLVSDTVFLAALKKATENAKYVLSVCTGAALLAKCEILDGSRATSNKLAFEWVKSQGPNVLWEHSARWVVDGKFYTSSGISAGMDMALGFVADIFSEAIAADIAHKMEYVRNENPDNDPFSV